MQHVNVSHCPQRRYSDSPASCFDAKLERQRACQGSEYYSPISEPVSLTMSGNTVGLWNVIINSRCLLAPPHTLKV